MTEPTPRLGRGGRWSAGLDEGLIAAAQPYDVAAARAERPREVFSWPQTAVVGARPTMDVGDMPEPPCADCGTTPCELAPTALALSLTWTEVHALYARIASLSEVERREMDTVPQADPALKAAVESAEQLGRPRVVVEPAPPSRRGWLGRAIRRIR